MNEVAKNQELLTASIEGLSYNKKEDLYKHKSVKYKLAKIAELNQVYSTYYFVNIADSTQIKTVKVSTQTGLPKDENFNEENSIKKLSASEYNNLYYKAKTVDKRKAQPKKEYTHTCPVCGKEFTDNSFNKVFCSEECYKKHVAEKYNANTVEEVVCMNCGKKFTRYTKAQKFCSNSCYRQYNNRKQAKKKFTEKQISKEVVIGEVKSNLTKKQEVVRTPKKAIIVKKKNVK